MQDKSLKFKTLFCATISSGWFVVIFQLYLLSLTVCISLPETIVRFFSFFTIQTNIRSNLLFPVFLVKSNWGLFFQKRRMQLPLLCIF
jgi:hypothetical protein